MKPASTPSAAAAQKSSMITYEKSLMAYHQYTSADKEAEHALRRIHRSASVIIPYGGFTITTLAAAASLGFSGDPGASTGLAALAAFLGMVSLKSSSLGEQKANAIPATRNREFLHSVQEHLVEQGFVTHDIDYDNRALITDRGTVTIEPSTKSTDPNKPDTYSLLLNGVPLNRGYQVVLDKIQGTPLNNKYHQLGQQ